MEFLSAEFFAALGTITLINLILSGDNAVVIALASRKLPAQERKKAVLWGTLGAVIFRIILTLVAALLLKIPYLQFIGGVALVYIAYTLIAGKKDSEVQEATGFWEAIKVIFIADVIMSLDNVLAIAAVAEGNLLILVIGLAMSIPLVVYGSQFLMNLMDKYPIIIYLGAAILGWTAGKMIVTDEALARYTEPYGLLIEIGLAIGVVLIGLYRKTKQIKNSEISEEMKKTDSI